MSSFAPLRSNLLTTKYRIPNLTLFILNRQRLLSTTSRHHFLPSQSHLQPTSSDLPFRTGPSPPRLPKEEQDLFEALQRQSTGAFSTPQTSPQHRSPPQINQSPDSNPSDIAEAENIISRRTANLASQHQDPQHNVLQPDPPATEQEIKRVIEARGKGEELHPNIRRGATPEFDGDVNPKTGEVGGPKNEPLRWGSAGEWSYNGRTTDF
jgi:Protein of unknown function (DUF1674)